MPPTALQRTVGLPGAVFLGLGSILGTGVFVSIGLGAGAAGGWVILATLIAGLLAACNALSSAQLAAAHPVSGGTYEYGYPLLSPALGFGAGWMFLSAKSASAATAALGFAGYALGLFGVYDAAARTGVALGAIALLTLLVIGGLRRSSRVNTAIVSVTLVVLTLFVLVALDGASDQLTPGKLGLDTAPGWGFPEACALMFVAYTGYGRIATLGEEVRDPARTIPRAIVVTLLVSGAMYVLVALASVASLGCIDLASATLATGAPLEEAALSLGHPWLAYTVAVGAVTAMLGVLLNLILGLSRVALAMGRRRDLPALFARVNAAGTTPLPATILVGTIILGIAAVGSIELAWSFSAFTVLVYYAVTHLAALRLPREQRRYPRWIAWCGLAGCLGLAFWVDARAWIAGLMVLLVGFVVHAMVRSQSAPTTTDA